MTTPTSPHTSQPDARTRSTRRRRLLGGSAIVLLVVAAGLAIGTGVPGRGSSPSAQPASSPADSRSASRSARSPAPLDVFEVAITSFDITTTSIGEVRARTQLDIRNPLEGDTTIVEIVPEGTMVRKGDLLVKLNAENIQQRLDQELLSLESSRAAVVEAEEGYAIQLSENESALRAATLKVALAELDLNKWRQGEVESKRQDLEHEVDRTTKDEQRLRDKVAKSRELLSKGYYSADQLKQDELAWEQSQAALAKATLARQVYWQFEHPKDERTKLSAVEEARAELERTQRLNNSRTASRDADRRNKQQSLQIREQLVAKYQRQVESATIFAPQDGLVVYASSLENSRWGGDEGPLQVGSRVWPNQNLIVLPDTSEMIASVRVHESLASRIQPGLPATIRVDAVGDRRFKGVVEGVGILAEQTSRWMDPNLREYSVRISIQRDASDEQSQRLRPSMRCEAEIQLGRCEDTLAVPVQGIFTEGLIRYVHVMESPGRWVRRPVLVGLRSDRFGQIRAGLGEGDRVLLRTPNAGELLNRPWDPEQLAVAGLGLDDQGQVVRIGGDSGPNAGGDGPPGAPGQRRQRPRPAPAQDDIAAPAAPQPTARPEVSTTDPAPAGQTPTASK